MISSSMQRAKQDCHELKGADCIGLPLWFARRLPHIEEEEHDILYSSEEGECNLAACTLYMA